MKAFLALVTTCVLAVGCSQAPETKAPWTKVSPKFSLGDSTAPIVLKDGRLPNGTYWATVHRVLNSGDIVFRVMQTRFGATCDAWAKDNGMPEGCANDYAVADFDTELLAVDDADVVTVAEGSNPGNSFVIDFDTLRKLVRGDDVEIPVEYTWVNFPFILAIEDGVPVEINQFWVP